MKSHVIPVVLAFASLTVLAQTWPTQDYERQKHAYECQMQRDAERQQREYEREVERQRRAFELQQQREEAQLQRQYQM